MACALVAEPSLPICAAVRKFLQSARHQVLTAHSVPAAIEAMGVVPQPELIFAAASPNFDGEGLCARIKASWPASAVVLIYPPDEDRAEERAARVEADAFLLGPLKRAAVVAISSLVLQNARLKVELAQSIEAPRVREAKWHEANCRLNQQMAEQISREGPMKQRILTLENETVMLYAEVGSLRDRLDQPVGEVSFLRRFLPLEVKRSRRYQYPIAVVLMGLDELEQRVAASGSPESLRKVIRAEAIAGIHQVIRDIDLTVPFTDDRYLVLLPHTPREGAISVASRLQAELSKMQAFAGGTASAGVASYEPKYRARDQVSFGGLIHEATAALLRVQTSGGGGVEVAPMKDRPKRDRISIG